MRFCYFRWFWRFQHGGCRHLESGNTSFIVGFCRLGILIMWWMSLRIWRWSVLLVQKFFLRFRPKTFWLKLENSKFGSKIPYFGVRWPEKSIFRERLTENGPSLIQTHRLSHERRWSGTWREWEKRKCLSHPRIKNSRRHGRAAISSVPVAATECNYTSRRCCLHCRGCAHGSDGI